MNLFKTSKTSRRTYSKSIKPVVKRSNLCLKMKSQNFAKVGFVKKESLNDKFDESKLSHETDCHRFDKYKGKKPLWKHLGTASKLKVPPKTYLG